MTHSFFKEELNHFETDYKELKSLIDLIKEKQIYELLDNQFFTKLMNLSQVKNPLKARRVVEMYILILSSKQVLEHLCTLSVK